MNAQILGENLPPPDVLAGEIIDNLEAALEQFRGVAAALAAANDQ